MLPATTAAGGAGVEQAALRGDRTSIGRKAPAEGGASGSVRTRTAKKAADLVTESGQLRLPSTCGSVPAKSRVSVVAGDRRLDPQDDVARARRRRRPRARPRPRRCRRAARQGGPGAALGVGEDLLHPRAQQVEAVALGELGQALGADPVRGPLGAQVGEALLGEAHPGGDLAQPRACRPASAGSRPPLPRGSASRPACCRASARRRRRGGRGRRRSRSARRRRRPARSG